MIRIVIFLVPLAVAFYTVTFGLWAWRKGHRRGAVGTFLLAGIALGLAYYALFIRIGF
jgi:hypothetical protein